MANAVRYLAVAVACNDPRNGLFEGRASGLTFRGNGWSVDFDHDDFERGQSFKVHDQAGIMVFGHANFAFVASREWVGNWCVNEYVMVRRHGLRLLHYINRHNDWALSGGDSRVFDWLMGLYSRPDYLPHVAIQPVPKSENTVLHGQEEP